MENGSPFAQVAPNPEPIIARVRRHLGDECGPGRRVCPPAPDLDRAAAEAVHALWNSRVRTFVEVLALREAREVLRGGLSTPLGPSPRRGQSATDSSAPASPGFRLDEGDSLLLSDDGPVA